MNINGHEVERMTEDCGRLRIDGKAVAWWADKEVSYYEERATATRKDAEEWELVAEFRRRELAEQEQAARDAELDRRAMLAQRTLFDAISASYPGEAEAETPESSEAERGWWREVVQALDADAAERGEA